MKKKVLGVDISIASKMQVLEYITRNQGRKYLDYHNRNTKYYIVTPNPELIVMANSNSRYKKVLNKASLALPDGAGLIWAGKILGVSLKERITGIGLLESICQAVAKQPITVSFLGGGPKIAERTAECLKKRFPSLKVKFAGAGITNFDKLKGTDILFVAFGSPKQELWIAENLNKLPIRVAIGVGGAFDMISGKVARAPLLIRNLGLEWLFRLIIQPWRLKRQLRLPKFVFLVLREKFK